MSNYGIHYEQTLSVQRICRQYKVQSIVRAYNKAWHHVAREKGRRKEKSLAKISLVINQSQHASVMLLRCPGVPLYASEQTGRGLFSVCHSLSHVLFYLKRINGRLASIFVMQFVQHGDKCLTDGGKNISAHLMCLTVEWSSCNGIGLCL